MSFPHLWLFMRRSYLRCFTLPSILRRAFIVAALVAVARRRARGSFHVAARLLVRRQLRQIAFPSDRVPWLKRLVGAIDAYATFLREQPQRGAVGRDAANGQLALALDGVAYFVEREISRIESSPARRARTSPP